MRRIIPTILLIVVSLAGCSVADASTVRPGEMLVPATEQPLAEDWSLATSAQQFSQRPVEARLWVEGDRDLFQRGDRLRLQFRTSRDAHVAILHVSPDGDLDFLFPNSPREGSFVRGMRTYSLPGSEWSPFWTVGSRGSGMGFFFIVASPEPLDFRSFQSGSRWDLGLVGGQVRGDPFWLVDQLTALLVPGWRYTPHAVDYYTYHVGRRASYPSFACYDGIGWRDRMAWNAYYGSCDHVRGLLRSNPYYYDSRRYRGDRRAYWRQLEAPSPRHSFKEAADVPALRPAPSSLRPEPGRQQANPAAEQQRQRREEQRATPVRTERQRPTLERRPPERQPERQQPERRPERTRDRQPERQQEQPSARPQPRQEEQPAAQSQPRQQDQRARPSQSPSSQRPAPSRAPRRDPPAREAPAREEARRDAPAASRSTASQPAAPAARRPGG